jgi:iron complex transport system permease protein
MQAAELRHGRFKRVRRFGIFTLLAVLLLAGVLLSFSIGSYPVSLGQTAGVLGAALGWIKPPADHAVLENVLFEIRLPRICAAILVGMALSGSGTALQAVFRNPLVSPGLLGVLAGSALGAAVGMLMHGSWLTVQAYAFGVGLLAVAVTVAIAGVFGRGSTIALLLGGIISGALFSAMLSMVKYVADPSDQLPSITYWLMGSLASARMQQLLWLALPLALVLGLLCALGKALDIVSMGDDEARTLGVRVGAVRYGVIFLATLATAVSVSIAGMIGWVGLLAPHIARLLLGPGNVRLMPASLLLGASFLVFADCLARSLGQVEIPIGVVTECLGLPAFLLVLHRARRAWQ